MKKGLQIQFYGVRGSLPASARKKQVFGSNTSCFYVQAGERHLIFDCGTGGAALGSRLGRPPCTPSVDLFLSHVHIDHILGLLSFAPLFSPNSNVTIYSEAREGKEIQAQIDQIMSPPVWPINTSAYTAAIDYRTIEPNRSYDLHDGITVRTMRSNHPNISTILRLEYEGTSLVYALDYEHDTETFPQLADFCRDADLVIYDAAFTDEEYESHQGWGHSTWQKGAELQERSGAKAVALAHLPYQKADEELLALDKLVRARNSRCFLAREGMHLTLAAGQEPLCKKRPAEEPQSKPAEEPQPKSAETRQASPSTSHVNIRNMLEIAAALSKEKDYNKLLARILREAMDITSCDGGTLYLLVDNALHFKIMRTVSMDFYKGADGESPGLPPVPLSRQNVCAWTAIEKRMANVEDVYHSDTYDFSGPRNYDRMTGYHTQSMLVVPMENHYGDIIGVLQLINAQDETGQVIPFAPKYEEAINSLASLAAVSITNMNYVEDIRALLNSFVEVISTAIDQRTPYNANHTRNMVRYAQNFLLYLNQEGTQAQRFDPEREAQFLMSVWLHDIGKMVIPLEVMDKESRLGGHISQVRNRLRTAGLTARIASLEGRLDPQQYQAECEKLTADLEQIEAFNTTGFLNDEALETIERIANDTYINEDGQRCPLLTPEEKELLSIRKGTLSGDERRIMESHVEITEKLLNKIHFSKDYDHVALWASGHHEYLNGTGYPRHLSGEQIPLEVRILTILDIYDALTARDRPYKPPMPVEKALFVLEDMAAHGQLDPQVVSLFRASRAWEETNTQDVTGD